MRRLLTAFFGFIFVVYFLYTSDLPGEKSNTLDPVKPSIIRTTQSLRLKDTLTKVRRPKPTDIKIWLRQEAELVGQVDPDPEETQSRLKDHADKFSPAELSALRDAALNIELTGDERFLAVYVLGLSNHSRALELLKDIGQAQVPNLQSDREYSDEFSIRAHALEAVVRRLPPRDSVNFLKGILATTADPALARHAQYWLTRLS